MTEAHAIIGAGWGDEGKGMATDALVAKLQGEGRAPVVVRSNGGAQAGHGVMTPDRRHHVFHHIGSGAFLGAPSHLSRFFVAHPMLLGMEIDELADKDAPVPVITIDPRAPVTTPWDMAINQVLERARGGLHHGSCGLGFGETIARTEEGPSLTAGDLFDTGLEDKLMRIMRDWVPARVDAHGVELYRAERHLQEVLGGNPDYLRRFVGDVRRFAGEVSLMDDAALSDADAVVFEGAQGLRLDMDLGEFPHVTRSRTGLPNMVEVANEAGLDAITTLYLTRAYATRHGRGPLPLDRGTTPLGGTAVQDLTNAPNAWQGHIRYAPLHLHSMGRIISADIERVAGQGVEIHAGLGVTCLDQVRGSLDVNVLGLTEDEETEEGPALAPVDRDAIADVLRGHLGLPIFLQGRGPTRLTAQIEISEVPSYQPG